MMPLPRAGPPSEKGLPHQLQLQKKFSLPPWQPTCAAT